MRRVYNGKGIVAPVLWIHGDEDTVFTVENIKEGLRYFANLPVASYKVVKGESIL